MVRMGICHRPSTNWRNRITGENQIKEYILHIANNLQASEHVINGSVDTYLITLTY